LRSSATEPCHLGAAEQAQQLLERAAMFGGGVELEGKPASIKSISECIQFSNASSLSSSFSRISLAGSRRQLSVAPRWRAMRHSSVKNERKRDSDEPGAPLLPDGENLSWEADVLIGREQSFAVADKPPPGRRRIPTFTLHRKQPQTRYQQLSTPHPVWPTPKVVSVSERDPRHPLPPLPSPPFLRPIHTDVQASHPRNHSAGIDQRRVAAGL
jgi:hypothetical protein